VSILVLLCCFWAITLIAPANAATPDGKQWKAYVRVKTAYRNGQVKVWASDDNKSWTYISSSAPYLPTETDEAAHPAYLFALEYIPAYLRVGVTGPFLGRTSIDSIEVQAGSKARQPLSLEPVGEVIDPDNVKIADGRTAIIVHRGQTDSVDGFIAHFKPTAKPASRRAKKVHFGNYTGPYAAEDRRAETIARWDFTVFQQGNDLGACVRKVKQHNPAHRVVLRLVYPIKACCSMPTMPTRAIPSAAMSWVSLQNSQSWWTR